MQSVLFRQLEQLRRGIRTVTQNRFHKCHQAADKAAESQKIAFTQKKLIFVEQDSDVLFAVFEKRKKQLWDALGPAEVDSIHHIGSSAIRGMPGPPMVDILMLLHAWPPSENIFKTMEDLKFVSLGDAPHQEGDKWFKFFDEGTNMQDIGSGICHVVHKDNESAHATQILFVEYCNNDKEAFEAYKAIKLEAKETENFGAYKQKKAKLLHDLLPKAVLWKKEQQQKDK